MTRVAIPCYATNVSFLSSSPPMRFAFLVPTLTLYIVQLHGQLRCMLVTIAPPVVEFGVLMHRGIRICFRNLFLSARAICGLLWIVSRDYFWKPAGGEVASPRTLIQPVRFSAGVVLALSSLSLKAHRFTVPRAGAPMSSMPGGVWVLRIGAVEAGRC